MAPASASPRDRGSRPAAPAPLTRTDIRRSSNAASASPPDHKSYTAAGSPDRRPSIDHRARASVPIALVLLETPSHSLASPFPPVARPHQKVHSASSRHPTHTPLPLKITHSK